MSDCLALRMGLRLAKQLSSIDGSALSPVLSDGTAGLVLLASVCEDADPGGGWAQIGQQWLSDSALGLARSNSLSAALFGGAAGLGVAAGLQGKGMLHQRLLDRIDETLVPATAAFEARYRDRFPLRLDADVISGVAGILRYWLTRLPRRTAVEHCHRLIGVLVATASAGDGVLDVRFPEKYREKSGAVQKRSGASCLGLAHGSPGVLSVVALAMLHDVDVAGLASVVDKTSTWLAGLARASDSGPVWPLWSIPTTPTA